MIKGRVPKKFFIVQCSRDNLMIQTNIHKKSIRNEFPRECFHFLVKNHPCNIKYGSAI